MKELLEAGAHFGHQTQRWNPKMAPFIFDARNKVHIIDLAKTVEKLEEAKKFVSNITKNDGKILFVGTKKQAQTLVKEAALKCGMPYVTERWLGGMITNFQTIASRTKYLKDLKRKLENSSTMIKKERVKAEEEVRKIEENLGGIIDLTRLPDAIFVIDVTKEMTAVKEARKMNIPIVAVVDTNANPELIDYPIPANDDAVKSIQLISNYLAEAILACSVKLKDETAKAGTATATEKNSEGKTVGTQKNKKSDKEKE